MNMIRNKLFFSRFPARLISSWFLISFFSILFNKDLFTSLNFMRGQNQLFFFLGFILILSLLTIFQSSFQKINLDAIFLYISIMLYGIACVIGSYNIYFAVGVCLFITGISVYLVYNSDLKLSFKLTDKALKNMAIVCAVAMFISIGTISVLRYLNYFTPNFDFGIFSQMFHYMKETFTPMVTSERDTLLSHFKVHISPIYYLWLPLYYVFPSPITLLLQQAFTIAIGILPLLLLCRVKNLSNKVSLIVVMLYALYPSLTGGVFYDLHENKFLTPLILFLFYFIEKDYKFGIGLMSVLVLFVKEDAPIYIAFIAIYLVLCRKKYLCGIIMFIGSVTYFLLAVQYLKTFGDGAMLYRYGNYMYGDSESLLVVIKAVILNPAYVISQIFTVEKLEFILLMFLPLAFLPVLTTKFSRFILLCPLILINLMSNYVYQHSIFFQYTYGVTAFLFYMCILNLADLKGKSLKLTSILAISFSIIFFFGNILTRTSSTLTHYLAYKSTTSTITEVLERVPENVSVTSSTFFIAKLSRREIIYEYPTKNITEYVILDLRFEDSNEIISKVEEDNYQPIEVVEGLIGVYYNPEYEFRNPKQ